MAPKPVRLDGSTLEGGGQLVRVAIALSAITSIPVSIYNIRANRAPGWRSRKTTIQGGLKESHLAAILYLAEKCDAYIDGAQVGSREVTFVPGAGFRATKDKLVDLNQGSIRLQGAGSVWLILQAILPWAFFSPHDLKLSIHGGTNVSKSMSGDYVEHVLLPTFHRIGLPEMAVEVLERGWAGGASHVGQVKVTIAAKQDFSLSAFQVTERGEVKKVLVRIVAQPDFANLFSEILVKEISDRLGEDLEIEFLPVEDSRNSRRVYVLLIVETTTGWRLGRDCLGSGRLPKHEADRRKIVQEMTGNVVEELREEMTVGGCVDEFMQDQLIIFQALATGKSLVDGGSRQRANTDVVLGDGKGSLHTQTVRWVCEEILRKESVSFEEGGICNGMGWNAPSALNKPMEKREVC